MLLHKAGDPRLMGCRNVVAHLNDGLLMRFGPGLFKLLPKIWGCTLQGYFLAGGVFCCVASFILMVNLKAPATYSPL